MQFAVFRHLSLLRRKDLGGSPAVLLFADRPLPLGILGRGPTSVAILYLAG